MAPQDASDPTATLRGRILDAAFATFMQTGYAAASTLAIASRARVSKRDLYVQFGSKQALLDACVIEQARRMRVPLALPRPRDRGVLLEALIGAGATLLDELCRPEALALFRLAIVEAERSPELALAVRTAGAAAAEAALAVFLAEAQAACLFGAGAPADMARQFLALLSGTLPLSLLLGAAPPGPNDMERRARRAVDALLTLYPPPFRPSGPSSGHPSGHPAGA